VNVEEAVGVSGRLRPYEDGRWWVVDHFPTPKFPLVCRGNTGEVYPNVVTPLTGSIVNVPFLEGQAALSRELGLATPKQLALFDGVNGGITAVFGGLPLRQRLTRPLAGGAHARDDHGLDRPPDARAERRAATSARSG
jgi:hypothetical protein